MKIILSALLVVIFEGCLGQQLPQAGERITSSSVSIYNNANQKISILLGDTLVKLDTFILKPMEVWHSPTYQHDPVVKIQTPTNLITYHLKRGNSFMIYWNERKKYWDLKKIRNR